MPVTPDLAKAAWPCLLPLLLVVLVPCVRRAFANGWRCLCRHSTLWKTPLIFALAYSVFQMLATLLLQWRLTGHWFPEPVQATVPSTAWMIAGSLLPAAESLAADLNCLVATFPLSALAGLLFLCNFRRLASELRRALCKRFGGWGWVMQLGLALCALAAMAKPVPSLAFPELTEYLPFRELMILSILINAFSFVFEYLLGTCLQIALVLIAYGWIRGLQFDRERLLGFAVRRLGVVVKWSLAIILATLALIHLPMLVEALITDDPAEWKIQAFTNHFSRPFLSLAMLTLTTVQIHLVLHNDSLRRALAAHAAFLRAHGFTLASFLLGAFSVQWTLRILENYGTAYFRNPFATHAWGLFFPLLSAAAGGWILAAWVCYYKGRESGTRSIAF